MHTSILMLSIPCYFVSGSGPKFVHSTRCDPTGDEVEVLERGDSGWWKGRYVCVRA